MKRICVFAGSSSGARADYGATADLLADEIVARDLTVVYGGAGIGLMGRLADRVLSQGGEVIGVIPETLRAIEIEHPHLSELRLVGSMHERKATMSDLADGFITLPGGLGTLDETCEILSWAQLGLHRKPIGLLNVRGYYDNLVAFLDHAVDEGFVKADHRDMLILASEPGSLFERMAAYRSPGTAKIDRVAK